MAPVPDKCDVVVVRGQTGAAQSFPLSSGGVLRFGRGVANDVVLDFNGVSVYHCELYLRPSAEPGQKPLLCIRDTSKNGVAVRPGTYAAGTDAEKAPAAWEPLKPDALRVLEHGWQIMVPLRSRKEGIQLPEAWRTVTVFIGEKPAGVGDLDGEAWEPSKVEHLVAPAFGLPPPPPPPDLGGQAFEEAPPPPPGTAVAAAAPPAPEEIATEDEKEARKRAKKEKKAKKKLDRASGTEGSDDTARKEKKLKKKEKKKLRDQEDTDEESAGKKKKDKKKKDKKKKADRDSSAEERVSSAERFSSAEPQDDKALAKKQREEELQALERELEGELAMEMNRKTRVRKKEGDGDDTDSVYTYAQEAKTDRKKRGEDESEQEEDDDLKSAWSRALTKPRAPGSDHGSSAVSARATVASAGGTASAEVPAVVEVLDSTSGSGIFLRYGTHSGHPVYRRLKDEKEPVLLYFWTGGDDRSLAGWYIAANFDKKGQDDYQDFWKSADAKLPVAGKGECGGRMEVRGQLDGPALTCLSELPEAMRTTVRTAFYNAVQGATGIPEEEEKEIRAEVSGQAEAAPEAAAGGAWKRRQAAREADAAAAPAAEGAATEKAAEAPAEAAIDAAKSPEAAEKAEEAPAAAEKASEEAEKEPEALQVPESAKPSEPEEQRPPQESAVSGVDESAPMADDKAPEDEQTVVGDADAESRKGDATEPAQESKASPTEEQAAEPAESEATNTELAKAAATDGGDATEPAGTHAAGLDDDAAPTEAARRKAAAEVEDGRESVASHPSLTTTNPQKTVPGDRGASQAPTLPANEDEPPAKRPARRGGVGLTAEALQAHTRALARAQEEAYQATFAQARSHYSKSIAGRSIPGKTIGGTSIAGRSIAGKSIAGRSVTGKSIAFSAVAPSVRTAFTTRELLVNNSEMRELMRSVSPISEPGVAIQIKRKGKRGRKSPTREQTPLISAPRDPSPSKVERKKKKKVKGDKTKVVKKARLAAAVRSPSPFKPLSPTAEGSVSAQEGLSTAPSGPARWLPEPSQSAAPPKKKRAAAARAASPLSDDGRARKRKVAKGGQEVKREEGKRKRK